MAFNPLLIEGKQLKSLNLSLQFYIKRLEYLRFIDYTDPDKIGMITPIKDLVYLCNLSF